MARASAILLLTGVFVISFTLWTASHARVPPFAHFHTHPAAGSSKDLQSAGGSVVTYNFGPKVGTHAKGRRTSRVSAAAAYL
eukprot:scaffold2502_cov362-Prasinococcus_capsulatus_cf.AAC.3